MQKKKNGEFFWYSYAGFFNPKSKGSGSPHLINAMLSQMHSDK